MGKPFWNKSSAMNSFSLPAFFWIIGILALMCGHIILTNIPIDSLSIGEEAEHIFLVISLMISLTCLLIASIFMVGATILFRIRKYLKQVIMILEKKEEIEL